MIAHTKWKNMSVLGKLLGFWGEEKASWSCDSASGSCCMQTCSWLLLTGLDWSEFASTSSITDFLQSYLFFRRMWVDQNHNFLQKPLLSQTLEGRCSYIQKPFGQEGRPHSLNVQGTWAAGERSALHPWHPWPRTASKGCLSQLAAWWRSGVTFPCMSSHCP